MLLHGEMFLPSYCINSDDYNLNQSLPLIIALSWQCLSSWKSRNGLQVSVKRRHGCCAELVWEQGLPVSTNEPWQSSHTLEAWEQDFHGHATLLILSSEISLQKGLS